MSAGVFICPRVSHAFYCDYLINNEHSHHIEISLLNCRANQLTGSYIMGTLIVNGFKCDALRDLVSSVKFKNVKPNRAKRLK